MKIDTVGLVANWRVEYREPVDLKTDQRKKNPIKTIGKIFF